MPSEIYKAMARGRVRQVSNICGVLSDRSNLVVDTSLEVMLQALLGRDQIDAIVFGDTGGAAATPGLRAVVNPIRRAPAGTTSSVAPIISKDENGLSSVGTWTAVYLNQGPGSVTYDMLGLVSQNDRLFAATASFGTVTLAAGESITVEWTILLAGR
jgi:hypothetical protein